MENIMKTRIFLFSLLSALLFPSCNGFLDLEPEAALSPEQYLTTEENIGAYATDLYTMLPKHERSTWGYWRTDADTDDMVAPNPSDKYAPGYWRVEQTGGSYSFTDIYRCNYFLNFVMPLYEAGEITGNASNIRHYIGEVYFFRAWAYFEKLKALGDFPIVEKPVADDLAQLTAASKRSPRNEVARFILADLDRAIEYMSDTPPTGGTNRLADDCAHLMKSRVALYEGTWEKYFKGTAFVPNGPQWPGAAKDYNQGYQFPSGSIDGEISFFLKTAMDEAKIVADKYQLTTNTGVFQKSADDAQNPYFDMFGAVDMSQYPEILLWRDYSVSLGIYNSVGEWEASSNNGYGITKSMVDAFVMSNGLPIYKAGSGYPGDKDLLKITENRDSRAVIFIKKPGDLNLHSNGGPNAYQVEPWPKITSAGSQKYITGYAIRKGLNFDGAMASDNSSETGLIIFRAAEAYLNYIEACYENTGGLDGDAQRYWKAIRDRARVGDYQTTIDNTDVAKEAETDWGAYSAGQLVDPTLYNIRRERRCELMAEGFRAADIRRWRSMDQLIDEPYHVLGVNLWDELADNADFLAANSGGLRQGENVSPRNFGKYLAPYHIMSNNRVYNGYSWRMAHYLDPIAVQHFLITGDGNVDASPLYQNPGWPVQAGLGAQN